MRSASIDTAVRPVPWADLPAELCGLVVDRLDAFSALRFPAVCKPWAAAYRATPRRLRSGAPTLLMSCSRNRLVPTFALHDVSSSGGKTFHAEAEGLSNRWWVGGKDAWLVTTDARCDVELLNPATGDVVRLPSFATIPGATLLDSLTLRVAPSPAAHLFHRVALCRTPAHRDGGYLAIAIFSSCFLAFTAAGDERWTTLKKSPHAEAGYQDAIAHEGKIFAVDSDGNVYFWNMDGGGASDPPTVVRAPEIRQIGRRWASWPRFNLAPSVSGQRLLLVCMYVERRLLIRANRVAGGEKKTPRFHTELLPSSHGARSILLHELDGGGAWRRVDDLGGDGDRALFVGCSYPFYAAAVAPPHECSHLKANNVYAADLSGRAAVVFDLGQGCADRCGPLVLTSSLLLRRPIWFRPATQLEGSACR
ncbi:unnamed protein product [Urochloa decumbens]|uniref:KIB1-4 beta-propeller domain-containing protein n=1 Tax=Urochloa decumbens TaxID=240449 RepID=A0ABC8XIE3_9POAL